MGSLLTATITDLLPDTEYRYSVRVNDPVTGMESSGSNEVSVTTLPATFDYLRPELAVESFDGGVCNVSWTPVADAEEYLLSLYTKSYGTPETATADFTGGISGIPTGWESSSNLTYANTNYCGAEVPSLRFNTDGQWLNTAAYDEIRGIRFWARGVSASDKAAIELYARASRDWTLVQSWPVRNDAGQIYEAETNATWPEGVDMLRILFRNGGKGSLAVDDVTVSYGGEISCSYYNDTRYFMTTTDTKAKLPELTPGTSYWLTVTARQGELYSKPSREHRIVSGLSGVGSLTADVLSQYSVSGRDIAVSVPASLYTTTGMLVASGSGTLTAPAPGIYVLVMAGNTAKIIIK